MPSQPVLPASLNLLGVTVQPLTIADLNVVVAQSIATRGRQILACHNLHSVYLHRRDPLLRAYHAQASVTHIDGMPLILWARLLGAAVRRDQRVAFLDWYPALLSRAAVEGWKVFYVGSRSAVAEQGMAMLRHQFAGLAIQAHHGYFDVSPGQVDNEHVIQAINAFAPQILIVGMGTPRQELWILENFNRLQVNVTITCGSSMECIAGVTSTAPRWTGKFGIEWLCRLWINPRQLWRRYLWEPWFLLPLMIADWRRSRKPYRIIHSS